MSQAITIEPMVEKPSPRRESDPPRVLVLGDDTRSFLATVRSLGRYGIEVHVAPTDLQSPALRSRYIKRIHKLPSYVGDGSEWARSVLALLNAEHFSLVIPCQDTALLPFHANRALFEPLVRLAIPDTNAIEVLFDKERTKELAVQLGVNIARTLDPRECPDPAEIFRRLGAPLVVKPKNSFLLNSLHQRGVVRIVDTPMELSQATASLSPGSYYLEEFFQGRGVGVSVLADRGNVLLAFQHHRVHEGSRGGAAPYRISATLAPELFDACKKMVGNLRFTGVAMFEFRRNFTTGRWILLEVNARPWGSLPLPIALGIDFPYWWYRLLVDGERAPWREYKVGIYGRNLGLDLQFLLGEFSEAHGLFARTAVLWRWIASFSHIVTGREYDDTIVLDDPHPGFLELGAVLGNYAARLRTRLPFSSDVNRFLAQRHVDRTLRTAHERYGRVKLLFVCFGNICRSPFAEAVAGKLLGKFGNRVIVESAGTYPLSGRESPVDAIEAAREFGIDLSNHRSLSIDDDLSSDASIIFAFDSKNCSAIGARLGTPPCPVVLLGSLARDNKFDEIADPFGRTPAEYKYIYGQIVSAVQSIEVCLSALLEKPRPYVNEVLAPVHDSALSGQITFSVTPVGGFANLGEVWRDLEARADASFFLTWDWIGCWLEQTRLPAFVLSGERDGEVVVLGIINPASYRRHALIGSEALLLNQVGDPDLDSITIEYNGLLLDRGMAEPALRECLQFLQGSTIIPTIRRTWDEIHLHGVPDGIDRIAQECGLSVWLRSRKPSWRVELDQIRQSGSSYLSHLSANTRYQIRRSMRLYERQGRLSAKRAVDVDEAMRFHKEMEALHQRYWVSRGYRGSYAVPFYGRFHKELLARCLESRTVELVRVAAGDSVIGYVYNFIHNGWVCAYQTGLAYDSDSKLKPGLVAHYLCIERHLKEGARYYDFLAGDSQYKRSLGTPGPDLLELVLQRPIAKFRIESALREVKRAFTRAPLEA